MNHAAELIEDPQIRARGSVVECAGVPVPASPVRLSRLDGSHSETATTAPHTVGQDMEEVLSLAGFSADEIKELAGAGVV
jgi:crotonobetainyl-CoA:carnitine CoA-transferase CaiB-like acyl-CoA transferase